METSKCTLLPENLGEKVVKIDLDAGFKEDARALLFVAPSGFVKEHAHNGEKPSELYVDLTDYALHGAEKMRYQPEVAGFDSPTGRMEHSIEPIDYPRVVLAIKKSRHMFDNWRDFQNLQLDDYLNKLNIMLELDKKDGIFFLNSHGKDQFTGEDRTTTVSIDFNKDSVCYLSRAKLADRDSIWEETSLQALENARQQAQHLHEKY